MRLKIFHRTIYHYLSAVRENHNEVRLRPGTSNKDRLEFFLLSVKPSTRLRHYRDAWLNYVHYFDVVEPHTDLRIDAESVINTTSQYSSGSPLGCTFDKLVDHHDDLLRPFLGSSKYVENTADVWRHAIDIKEARTDVFETAEAVMQHIYQTWTYDATSTNVSTHMAEAMALKSGVCQDFAHVMIGICRAAGIPARYVSGYLFDAQGSHLRGAQASHAWCEIFIPDCGWFGLDPTNNTRADERHVKIATGRDYHDAAPVTGSFDGPTNVGVQLAVEVDVKLA